jgi:flagellar basal body-associated protein FliL
MDQNQGLTSGLNFQRIVIIIAIVMLIVAMVFIGYSLYRQSSDIPWPPETPKCPDYWNVDPSGNCTNPNPKMKNCEYNGIPAGTQGMPNCPS